MTAEERAEAAEVQRQLDQEAEVATASKHPWRIPVSPTHGHVLYGSGSGCGRGQDAVVAW